MEAVHSGTALLAGTKKDTIVSLTLRLFEDKEFYSSFATKVNPFGDGTAARKIVNLLKEKL